MNDFSPVVFRQKTLTSLWLIIGSAILIFGGVVMVVTTGGWLGWFAIVFFGMGVVVGFIQLVKPPYLKLSPLGIEVGGLRKFTVSWDNISSFSPINIRGMDMVGIQYNESYTAQAVARGVVQQLSGVEGALELYGGMSAQQQSDLLNSYLQQRTPAANPVVVQAEQPSPPPSLSL